MKRIIYEFKNNRVVVYYQRGKDNDWQVGIDSPSCSNFRPKDVDYFRELRVMRDCLGFDNVYADVIKIYSHVSETFDASYPEEIIRYVTGKYGIRTENGININDIRNISITYIILYAVMVSEYYYNDGKSVYKKTIKRLGFEQALRTDMALDVIANFSKGISQKDFTSACLEMGFDWRKDLAA